MTDVTSAAVIDTILSCHGDRYLMELSKCVHND